MAGPAPRADSIISVFFRGQCLSGPKPCISAEVVELLVASQDGAVRRTLAKNPAISAEILQQLARDPYHWVRHAVASSPHSPPPELLLELAEAPEDGREVIVLDTIGLEAYVPSTPSSGRGRTLWRGIRMKMEEYNQTGIYVGDIIKSALDGDPECCYKLGKLVGTPSSRLYIPETPSGPEGMAYWFMKAADLGHTDAQVDYAMLCIEGMGVSVNYAMAMKYLHMAASGANPSSQAMTNIASLHSQGLGVPQDYLAAREWWLKAAERGSRQSMYALGIMYQNGRFGQPDQEDAHSDDRGQSNQSMAGS